MVKTRSSTKDAMSKASSLGHTDDQEAAVLPSITTTASTGPPPQVPSPPLTGFFKLSAELRNQIYKLCLHSNKPFDVLVHPWNPVPTATREKVIDTGTYSLQPNLLATCKAIRNEATSILYGSSTFMFRRVIGVKHDKHHIRIPFFGQIGRANLQLIRQIGLRYIPRCNLSSVFRQLGCLHSLKALVVHESPGIGFYDPPAWSEHLAPMMRAWLKARVGEDLESLLDILLFRPLPEPESLPTVNGKPRSTHEEFRGKVVAALTVVTKQGQQEFDRQRQLRAMLSPFSDEELEQYKLHRALLG